MSQLTYAQIEQLWIANGGPPQWAPTMAGIALAESGGNTTSLNNNAATGDSSAGLWQINYFGSLGPSRTAAFGTQASLLNDPNAQAKAAISILNGGSGISAWKGDKVGNFAQNGTPLSDATVQSLITKYSLGGGGPGLAEQALDALGGQANDATFGLAGDAGGVAGLASDADTLITDVSSAAFWKRVGMGYLGASLVILGFVVLFESTDTGRKITVDAAKAAAA